MESKRLSAEHKEGSQVDLPEEKGRTVTIYFCGTGSCLDDAGPGSAYHEGEIISSAYKMTKGEVYVDKLIVDGVGSGEKDITTYWVPYPEGGYNNTLAQLYAYGLDERIDHVLAVLKNDPSGAFLKNALKKDFTPEQLKEIKILLEKNLSPEEAKEAVNHFQLSPAQETILVAHQKLTKAPPITRVIIAGWSRGGAAAISIAHKMATDPVLKEIPVCLALIDPVPGMGLHNESNTHLQSNVKQCIVSYARDENSKGFSPVIPHHNQGHQETRFLPIILPGAHAHVAGSIKTHAGVVHENIREVGRIMKGCFQQALNSFGTQFETGPGIVNNPLDYMLEQYRQVKQHESHYVSASSGSYTIKEGGPRVATWGDNYKESSLVTTKYYLKEVIEKELKFAIPESVSAEERAQYFDFFHWLLEDSIKKAKKAIEDFHDNLLKALEGNEELTEEKLLGFLKTNNEEMVKNPILVCAITEQLQIYYQKHHIKTLSARCYTPDQLGKYFKNLCVDIIALQQQKIVADKDYQAQFKKVIDLKIALEKSEDEYKNAFQAHEAAKIEKINARLALAQAVEEDKRCQEELNNAEEHYEKCQNERNAAYQSLQALTIPTPSNVLTPPPKGNKRYTYPVPFALLVGAIVGGICAAFTIALLPLVVTAAVGALIGTAMGYRIGKNKDQTNAIEDQSRKVAELQAVIQQATITLKTREENVVHAGQRLSQATVKVVDANRTVFRTQASFTTNTNEAKHTEAALTLAHQHQTNAEQTLEKESQQLAILDNKARASKAALKELVSPTVDEKPSTARRLPRKLKKADRVERLFSRSHKAFLSTTPGTFYHPQNSITALSSPLPATAEVKMPTATPRSPKQSSSSS